MELRGCGPDCWPHHPEISSPGASGDSMDCDEAFLPVTGPFPSPTGLTSIIPTRFSFDTRAPQLCGAGAGAGAAPRQGAQRGPLGLLSSGPVERDGPRRWNPRLQKYPPGSAPRAGRADAGPAGGSPLPVPAAPVPARKAPAPARRGGGPDCGTASDPASLERSFSERVIEWWPSNAYAKEKLVSAAAPASRRTSRLPELPEDPAVAPVADPTSHLWPSLIWLLSEEVDVKAALAKRSAPELPEGGARP